MALLQRLQSLLSPLAAGGSWYAVNTTEPAVFPFIVFLRVASTVNNTLSGASDLQSTRLQVDVYSRQVGEASAIAAAAAAALLGAPGFNALQLSSQDFYEPEAKAFRMSLDFSVWSTD